MNLAGDYSRWFTTLQNLLSPLSETEQTDIFYKNARSFYQID